jgi:hydrogenase expression/formation protein HypE
MWRLWYALHAGSSVGRADGVERRSMRGVLEIWPKGRGKRMTRDDNFSSACPLPASASDRVLLAHGEGARLTRQLIRDLLLPAFDNEFLRPLADSAILPVLDGELVMTTDCSVVSPLFFPGGDIGKLAVHSAVNDLAVCGAEPLYLSLAFILEEGLPRETLRKVVSSIAEAARVCGVHIVTGDTKVVPRGAADQLYINTTGVGRLLPGVRLGASCILPGDHVLISGTMADHGLAVLAAREGLDLGPELRSDTAGLQDLIRSLLSLGGDIHFLRDATRGGVAAILHEAAEAASVSIGLEEASLPLSPVARGACELLGLDPLHVANEGKAVIFTSAAGAEGALNCLRSQPLGLGAARIGTVTAASRGEVRVRSPLGPWRLLDEPSGSPMPRIC